MSDEPFNEFQISLQSKEKNITFRAGTAEDLRSYVADFTKVMDEIVENVTNIEQALIAKSVMSAPADTTWTAPAVTRQGPPSDTDPSCEHGPGKWASGTNKKTGKPYQGWYCPAPFGKGCNPTKISD